MKMLLTDTARRASVHPAAQTFPSSAAWFVTPGVPSMSTAPQPNGVVTATSSIPPSGSVCGPHFAHRDLVPAGIGAAGIDAIQGAAFAGDDARDRDMDITDDKFSTRLGPLIWSHPA